MELRASPGGCEEAHFTSRTFYIPCDQPAVFMVKNRDPRPYRMCQACTHHNVDRRGAVIVGPFEPIQETP